MSEPRTRRNWLLGLITAAPMGAYAVVRAVGLLDQSPEARIVAVAVAIGACLLGVAAFVMRTRQLRRVESRILRARPTRWCRTCGYSSDGLDTTRVDSGTLPFEHATCPECGRPNPR